MGLEGKVALITGANRGIGAATVKAFAAQGANIVIHYLEIDPDQKTGANYEALHTVAGKPAADELLQEIKETGVKATSVAGDLSDSSEIPGLLDRAEQAIGHVDILVNNAAHCEEPDNIFTITQETVDRTFAVNTRASVLLMSEYLRRHKGRGGKWGRILNISTDYAYRCFAGQDSYGASKSAIEAYTKSVSVEAGPMGVTVNCVAPGPVQTGTMTAENEKKLTASIPLRRCGQPEDIANALLFLASRQADWITGQVIRVDGGHAI